LTSLQAQAGGQVIGLDWRCDLREAWRTIGYDRAVQGNLDPVALLADVTAVRRAAQDVLAAAEGRSGHIFNLGHGVLPETPVENVRALVAMVHDIGTRPK
jgi:uroporphyrinogen decarboxylase